MNLTTILMFSLIFTKNTFAQYDMQDAMKNYKPPTPINVEDYPSISVQLDSSKKSIDCTLDKATKIYVCPGKNPVLVKVSMYGSFNYLELTEDHSSKIGNVTVIRSGDRIISDTSSIGGFFGAMGSPGVNKDLSTKVMTELSGINGFFETYRNLQGETNPRVIGGHDLELIAKEHLDNKMKLEEFSKTIFAEQNYQVEMDNGKTINCNRGTTKDLSQIEKDQEIKSGVKIQCGSFRCDNVNIDGKEYKAIMMYDSNPAASGSNSFHLIDDTGSGPVTKIRSIRSSQSKMPLVDNSYNLENPVSYGVGMGMNGEQVEVFPGAIPNSFSKNENAAIFKNPYFTGVMAYYWHICKNDNGALAALETLKDITLEKLANAELVQFIAVLADGRLLGQFIDPNDAANIGCFYNGVYLNKGAAKNLDRIKKNINPDESIDKTISKAHATELFNQARKMDDIAWDYKSDGCYARAHLMARRFEAEGVRVDKVWIKGNLSVPEAGVSWNFHVAPIVYVEENGKTTKMVIDPSLFDKPVTVEEWDKKMSKNTKRGSVITAFPFPENAAVMERSALAFSSSDPYLPGDNIDMSEDDKVKMAKQTMFDYKNINANNGIYNYPGMPQK